MKYFYPTLERDFYPFILNFFKANEMRTINTRTYIHVTKHYDEHSINFDGIYLYLAKMFFFFYFFILCKINII